MRSMVKSQLTFGDRMTKVLVTGATGLVGKALVKKLIEEKIYQVKVLSTNLDRAWSVLPPEVEGLSWNVNQASISPTALDDVDVVVHLAGEGIANKRWNEKQKKKILNSRVLSSRLLIEKMKENKVKPKKFISASAIGIYGDAGDETLTEKSNRGKGFLAEVCIAWEASVLENDIEEMKSCVVRTGLVLSDKGGALAKMLPAFKLGLGGKLGSGNQYMSWIHIDDLVSIYMNLIKKDEIAEIYNAVSPNPVTNSSFTKTLGKQLKRPSVLPVPGAMLKVALGEMSGLLLESQRVVPEQLMKESFDFKHSKLESALEDIL